VYLTIGDQHIKELESLMLRIMQPKGNKVKGGLGRSENLRRRFARDIKLLQSRELKDILGQLVEVSIKPVSKEKPSACRLHFTVPETSSHGKRRNSQGKGQKSRIRSISRQELQITFGSRSRRCWTFL
jgi:hypothetical protein